MKVQKIFTQVSKQKYIFDEAAFSNKVTKSFSHILNKIEKIKLLFNILNMIS